MIAGDLSRRAATGAEGARLTRKGRSATMARALACEVGGSDTEVVETPTWQLLVPGIALVTRYQRAWLAKDVVAGLVLSALLVPQGMAYAELAGLPPVTGLYTSILCLIGYAIFGPSRVLVLGPDSALGSMIAATIAPLILADGDPARAIALASLLAVLVGVIMVVAGLAKFGFVADLLSKPTQIGYMNGLALTIIVSQLPKLFGFSVDADGLLREVAAVVSGIAQGLVDPAAAVVGFACLAGILLLNRGAAEAAERAHHRRARVDRGECVRPAGSRGRHDRCAAPGLSAVHAPARELVGHPACCCSAHWVSPSLPWPTPCRRRRRSPLAAASRCTATRR